MSGWVRGHVKLGPHRHFVLVLSTPLHSCLPISQADLVQPPPRCLGPSPSQPSDAAADGTQSGQLSQQSEASASLIALLGPGAHVADVYWFSLDDKWRQRLLKGLSAHLPTLLPRVRQLAASVGPTCTQARAHTHTHTHTRTHTHTHTHAHTRTHARTHACERW